ncbi:hypothetical protein [Blastopirellula marina]|uniref:Uncharacterized protein n=1 Tax=Blastopirellula marina TaxID=124 RepID=A0A2S8GTF3_9BACT|nr:hypothetical protein [Blastopirellula marina]PQO47661.1 hypothetical protein C5Y93_03115 [Blastopirellula marina]
MIYVALRSIVAVLAGWAVAVILLIGVELFSALVHPFPEGFGNTHEEICAHVAIYPTWVLAVVVPMWGAIALVSSWTSGRIGGRWCAIATAVLLSAALLANVAMLPYPLWFKVAQPLVILVAAAAGVWLTAGRTATTTEQE